MSETEGLELPQGFRAAAATAGIKVSGKPDCGLIFSDRPLSWALACTTNRVRAACVLRNERLRAAGDLVQALAFNSGNANSATGAEGAKRNEAFAAAAAAAVGVAPAAVLTASTGIIGEQLPLDKLTTTLPELAGTLSEDASGVAQALLTTDLVRKCSRRELSGGARIVGIAKGSGMIHPNMATMFGFVFTDAAIAQEKLRELWRRVVAQSFNQVTVDGDTSTNDMAILLASGRVQVDEAEFAQALLEVAQDLAMQIAADGEGATKILVALVSGAADDEEARKAARAVVLSPLVKSAAHGNDPNWGRILSAVGATRVAMNLEKTTVHIQGRLVFAGLPADFEAASVSAAMAAKRLEIKVDLAVGTGSGTAWGCDLSAEYVRINADYHT